MNVEQRMDLVRQVGEEIVTEDELRALLADKPHPIAYDGFEPSGTIHIAQGVLRAINVNKMTRAGVRFKMFVADWHAWANNKMGGDLDKIQTTGRYITEIWKVAGMDLDHVKFVWASEFVQDESYWKKVMNIARDSSLDRILRTTQIMGRSEKDKLSAAQILYPCMQAADIFHLEADITQLGMDQRKVNMLAREVGPKLGLWKPVVVSHHMLMGLQAPAQVEVNYENVRYEIGEPIARVLGALRGEALDMALGTLQRLDKFPTEEGLAGIQVSLDRIASHARTRATEAFHRVFPELQSDFLDVRRRYLVAREALQAGSHAERSELADAYVWEVLQTASERSSQLAKGMGSRLDTGAIERATALKMSKSSPDSAIFMTDTPEQVQKKMNKAFCPEKLVEENPVMEYYRYIIFQRHWADHRTTKEGESPVTIERPDKFGGTVTFESYQQLVDDYVAGKVHPADLKKTAAKYINEILQPVREHFEKNETARVLGQQVESFRVTR